MRWTKRGIVYCPDGSQPWARVGAMLPAPLALDERTLRVYVTGLDERGVGRPYFVDVARDDPMRVLRVAERPCMDIGAPGTFDENGAVACSVLHGVRGEILMYYVGFELGTKIRYRLLTGLAVSRDGGETFERVRATPVLERTPAELYFRCGPHVVREDGRYRMWYIAGSSWTEVNGKPMPEYAVRHAESGDGVHWPEYGERCIDVSDPDEHGFGRPWVVRTGTGYEMYYSVRRRSFGAYRLGYAVSADGVRWDRRDGELGLDVSPQGFDAHAIMYSAVVRSGERTFCLYNGDDFGRAGFALAERVEGA
jgi:hypothetical protein